MNRETIVNHFVTWAKSQRDIYVLIQFGSRIHHPDSVDQWSDWDFHVICRNPSHYENMDWSTIFKVPLWNLYQRLTTRNAMRASFVLDGGLEIDLVFLSHWQMKIIYFLMNYPSIAKWFPAPVRKGIEDLQDVLLPKCQILKGDKAWEKRLHALDKKHEHIISLQESFTMHVSKFWFSAFAIMRAIARNDLFYAVRTYHFEMRENLFSLLLLDDNFKKMTSSTNDFSPRTLRCLNHWLPQHTQELLAKSITTDKMLLCENLAAEIRFFDIFIHEISKQHHLLLQDQSELKKWFLQQLDIISGSPISL